jgi:mono/diheme cytochrome c family protein
MRIDPRTLTVAALFVGLAAGVPACSLGGGTASAAKSGAKSADAAQRAPVDPVERGKYLVTAAGCNDCHTPLIMGPNGPERDPTRTLAGHPEHVVMPPAPAPTGPWIITAGATMTAWSGPWGVSYTANLTPDPETGLGAWTTQTFIDTIRNGRHMGKGRPLLPPMPADMIRNYTDEDLSAIFAYLQSIPPVVNHVPEPIPPAAVTR